jgi:hypothetical protein
VDARSSSLIRNGGNTALKNFEARKHRLSRVDLERRHCPLAYGSWSSKRASGYMTPCREGGRYLPQRHALTPHLLRQNYHFGPSLCVRPAAPTFFADKYGAKYNKAVAFLIKDRKALLASSTSPPSTGTICVHQTRSRACSRRCCIEPCRQRGPYRRRPPSSWCSNSSTPLRKTWRRLKGQNQLPKVV